MCHVHLKKKKKISLKKKAPEKINEQSGGASWWRVCYQRGLPRLVLKPLKFTKPFDNDDALLTWSLPLLL